MDRQSLVASTGISPELCQRLHTELENDPNAINNLRKIATRALKGGRIEDALLMGKEITLMQQMAAGINK